MPSMPLEPTTTRISISPEAFRNLDVKMKSTVNDLEKEVAKTRIIESALAELRGKPGFDPAALSISFGLRW